LKKRITVSRILVGVLVGGMLLFFGGLALAEDTAGADAAGPGGKFFAMGRGMRGPGRWLAGPSDIQGQDRFQAALDRLVKKGTYTQEKAEEIKKDLDIIQTQMKETAQEEQKQQKSEGLKSLVEKGTITQGQADKILAQFENERRQYITDNKDKLQDPLAQLVADKTITEDQASAVRDVLPHFRGHRGGRR